MSELVAHSDLFALTLLPKMALIAAFAVAATILAERAGPVIGGLIATTPVATGPIYVLLALDHNAAFIAASAKMSFLALVPAAVMIVVYVFLAQRLKTVAAISLSLAAWLCAILAVPPLDGDLAVAIAVAAGVFCAAIMLVRPYRGAALSPMLSTWTSLLLKGAPIAAVVGLVEIASAFAGPQMTGVFTAVPIGFIAMMALVQSHHGGPASGAVMANVLPGLAGLSVAFLCLSLTAVPLGLAKAMPLALLICMTWNASLLAIHILLSRPHGLTGPAQTN